jgi:cell division protein FtsB
MGTRRGLGFGGTLLTMLIVVGLAAAAGIIPFRQVLAHDRSVELARQQRDALTAANFQLEQQIAALETPGEVERLAREQFGMVMPGETAVVAIPIPDETLPVVERPTEFVDHTPWWRALWNFISGQDLAADE